LMRCNLSINNLIGFHIFSSLFWFHLIPLSKFFVFVSFNLDIFLDA
jgi:hypothetical protein